MPMHKEQLHRVGIAAYPSDAVPSIMSPYPSHAALATVATAGLPGGSAALVIPGETLAAEWWQLRAYTDSGAPATNAGEGLIVPADYDATLNRRVWFRS
ncbi:MAG: hypothetical protein LBM92_03020 [Opitutaceae bacterium]|jgi:hypothetical protein|nr:hypothetical protein [Opitutaceae bacterium]